MLHHTWQGEITSEVESRRRKVTREKTESLPFSKAMEVFTLFLDLLLKGIDQRQCKCHGEAQNSFTTLRVGCTLHFMFPAGGF